MKSALKIAFLTSSDPKDRNSWSGIYFQMLKSLESQFTDVIPLGPVEMNKRRLWLVNFRNLVSAIFLRQRYNVIHNNLFARYYAAAFKKKLKGGNFDMIFAPASSVEIAFLKTDIPICYFSDTSFSQIRNYYGLFSNLSESSAKESEAIQYKALKKSAIVIHASNWASYYVTEHYGIDQTKAYTLPMGANIDEAPDLKMLALKLNDKTTCNLLFLGVEWERKGGAIAFEALVELNKLGLDANLTICGCTPPEGFDHPKMKVIPFLDKSIAADYNQFLELLYKTHFLLLPTRAECAGVVFAEASAFGIPSITTDTGGVASMVENDVNGYRLPYNAGGNMYAGLIKAIFENDEGYKKLVYSSRAKYGNELNWETWGIKVKELILKNHKDS